MPTTTVDADEALLRKVLEQTEYKTEREAIEAGLRALLGMSKQKEVLKFFGSVQWEGDLDEMRRD